MRLFAIEVRMKGAMEIAPDKSRVLNYDKLRIAFSRDEPLLSIIYCIVNI